MSGMRQIFKKEMDRIFKDKKMVFSVFFLPVLMMVVLLSIINGLASNMEKDIESHKSEIYVMNEPASFRDVLEVSKMKCQLKTVASEKEMKGAKKEILEGEADLIVEFPEGFEEDIAKYQEGDPVPPADAVVSAGRRYEFSYDFSGEQRQ